jgi:S1-C subfamily serine protease
LDGEKGTGMQSKGSLLATLRRLRIVLRPASWLAVASCFGCAGYSYDGITYASREEALHAARQDIESSFAYVKESPTPIKGQASVIIPDRQRIRAKGVVTTGAVQYAQVEYIAEVLYLGYWAMADALRQANTFESIQVLESPDPQASAAATTSEYVIWLNLADANTAQWYLIRDRSLTPEAVAVDLGIERQRRAADWVEKVRLTAVEVERASTRDVIPPFAQAGSSAGRSSGSAFAIAPGTLLVSNYHVVAHCREVSTIVEGERVEVRVVHADPANDIVLLRADVESTQYASFPESAPRLGSTVVVVGFPLRGVLATSATATTGAVSNLSGPGNDARLLQISAPIQPGNSGGPVIDEYGRVIGVVTAQLDALGVAIATGSLPQNVNFALKHSVATNLLEVTRTPYRTRPQSNRLSASAMTEIGQAITFPIDCW